MTFGNTAGAFIKMIKVHIRGGGEENFGDIFSILDRNGDGDLTPKEAKELALEGAKVLPLLQRFPLLKDIMKPKLGEELKAADGKTKVISRKRILYSF